jgi:hypothetical protein
MIFEMLEPAAYSTPGLYGLCSSGCTVWFLISHQPKAQIVTVNARDQHSYQSLALPEVSGPTLLPSVYWSNYRAMTVNTNSSDDSLTWPISPNSYLVNPELNASSCLLLYPISYRSGIVPVFYFIDLEGKKVTMLEAWMNSMIPKISWLLEDTILVVDCEGK